ncbi:hypothetical protein [Photobacterium damselae]|uniref:hypothetical protein n=1 Tax=Photobacterium damselae TaxID=38293 RepID=UPI0018A438E8|nr:hypothetical protein [Photobacterium damselae]QOQ68675.1 hypothetical protein IL982_13405 [Photobacterium damselae subsp. damselae]
MTMKFTSTALILTALTTSTMVMAHDRGESYGMESATQSRVQALVTKHQQPIKLQPQATVRKDREESYGMAKATELRIQALVTKHEQPISVQSQGKKKDREESYGMNYATQLRVQALS